MRILRSFLRSQRGASVLEFAILAPILATMLVAGSDTWMELNRKQDMHAAIQAGAHYYMGGGTDDTVAPTVSLSGWANKPSDAKVTVVRACYCNGTTTDCSTVCTVTNQAPEAWITLTGTTQWNGLHPAALSESELVRVR
jgi:Flp pilus assembly protein TadG